MTRLGRRKRDLDKSGRALGWLTWFHILLWWGSEVVRQVLHVRRPRPQIVRVSAIDETWPVSSWVFTKEKVYGIFFKRYEHGVKIYEFPELEKN